MSAVLQEIGFTQEELQERVLERIVARLFGETDDEQFWLGDDSFKEKLDAQIKGRIDATVQKLADEHVLPHVGEYVEKFTVQETTKWGEAKGAKLSFTEYLIQRAHFYLTEEVNHDGKTKADDSYNFRPYTTRIAYLIEKHLKYHISTAMEGALKTANSAIADGIQGAVKVSLARVLEGIKTSVVVKS
jgi:hypothetical protein